MSDSKLKHIRYIENNIDNLDLRQRKTLLRYIAKHSTACLKESADGTRINLDILDINLVKKYILFVTRLNIMLYLR